MKIGLLTTRLFDEPASGGELCTARLVHALAEAGHEVSCLGRGAGRLRAFGAARVHSLGDGVVPFARLGRAAQAATVARVLLAGQATTTWRFARDRAARQVSAWLAERRRSGLDALIVDHLQPMAWLDDDACSPAPLVLMHNLEAELYAEQAAREQGRGPAALARRAWFAREARHLQALERRMLARCAAVACLSEGDAAALQVQARALGRRLTAPCVLPGYPVHRRGSAAALAAAPMPRRIGMLGTWTWGPNRAALSWMLSEVLPRLPAHCELVLAGSGLGGLGLPVNARSLGEVADPAHFYAGIELLALPALLGSGVQEKAIEALGSEHPIVATPRALRGLNADATLGVHAAFDAASFARLCAEAPLTLDDAARRRRAAWADTRRAHYAERLAHWLGLGAARAAGAAA